MTVTANHGPTKSGPKHKGPAAPGATDPHIRTLRLNGRAAPSPQAMAGLATRADAVAQRLGVAGLGGDPPLSTSSLPDPDSLNDQAQITRVNYVFRAEQLYGQNLAPIAPQLAQLRELFPRNRAAWQLYRGGYLVLTGVSDYLLAAAPAHRLVRYRVLPAVATVLAQKDLPEAERDGLGKDLAQMQGLINQEAADLRQSRDKTGQNSTELDQELAALDAEEHLVNVMLRMTTRQPVSDDELVRAGATYERLMAATDAADGAGDTTDPAMGQASDRRTGGR